MWCGCYPMTPVQFACSTAVNFNFGKPLANREVMRDNVTLMDNSRTQWETFLSESCRLSIKCS